jgi:Domain of unknown function DUF29
MSKAGGLYDRDVVLWTEEQAAALRALRDSNLLLDWENLAEEIESLGKSDRRATSPGMARMRKRSRRGSRRGSPPRRFSATGFPSLPAEPAVQPAPICAARSLTWTLRPPASARRRVAAASRVPLSTRTQSSASPAASAARKAAAWGGAV